jgi:2-methylcitrate dehydratase PrpD
MNEMQASPSTDLTRKLAEFASSFSIQSAPALAVSNAKLAILDCLGVSLLAVTQEVGQATLSFARDNCGAGPCTVWGTGITTGARDAAFCNGVLSHGLDYDDRNHSSTYTLAAAMAVAEQHDLSGPRVLEAFIVGREVRNSLDKLFSDRGSGLGPGAKGWHSNGILGAIAAACAVANALRLDSQTTLAALGLAAGSCGALTRDGGTMAKPFRTGHSAATGLTCVLLARSGFSSDETAIEGRFGLLDALSPIPDAALQSLGKNLGRTFHLEAGIRIKPFASCTASHSGIEAMLRLQEAHRIAADEVETIECDLRPYPLIRHYPKRGFEGRFSLPFCLAVALMRKRVAPEDFTDRNLADPTVQSLIARTRHVAGSAALTVTLRGGTILSESLRPHSDLCDAEQIEAKFHRSTAAILTDQAASTVSDMIQGLDRLPSVHQLTTRLQSKII